MTKDTAATPSEKKPEDKITKVDFRFGEDSEVQPTGLEGITIDEEVTVTLKGQMISFSSGESWDKSKRFSLKLSSCEIVKSPENKETSMDDALNEANEGRKKV